MDNNLFEKDLLYVADKVTDSLNMFNETQAAENKLLTVYGDDEFIALIITPNEDNPKLGHLRLRSNSMAASWDNVPVGFSQINESKGLLADMKRAAKLSLKRNSLWYISKALKDTVGDRVSYEETITNKGWLYKLTFENQYKLCLSLVNNDKEYLQPHDTAKLYVFSNNKKEALGLPMTADETLMALVDIAMQEDVRISKFIKLVTQLGGRAKLTYKYRTEDESLDEARVAFPNGYMLKLKIKNGKIFADLYGVSRSNKIYILDKREFDNINDVYDASVEFSQYPQYEPVYSE